MIYALPNSKEDSVVVVVFLVGSIIKTLSSFIRDMWGNSKHILLVMEVVSLDLLIKLLTLLMKSSKIPVWAIAPAVATPVTVTAKRKTDGITASCLSFPVDKKLSLILCKP